MKGSLHHPLLGQITISSTRRSTHISLSVRPSGEVRLSYPPYVSQRRALEFLESKKEWILQTKAKYAVYPTPCVLSAEEIEHLRLKAKQHLPQRVAQMASQLGLRYGRVTIRAARSKWGSCSAENNISLSLYLMMLPSHLQDYVIVHELCHTVHHNHSAKFHALVDKCLQGREKELAKELRQHHIPR